ncbi:MAG: FHA domain-containing protein [Anaerolineales bacterium]|nr:FHA domain-containing protein [Anaerolineales bacterium]
MFQRFWMLTALLLICTLFGTPLIVTAQSSANVRVSDPIIDAFPRVTLFVQVIGEDGRRITNLPTASFSLFEDNELVVDLRLDEALVGTRLAFVLNTTSDLRIRDSLGRTRLDLIQSELLEWWTLPDFTRLGFDDYSLVTAHGTLISHSQSIAELAATLDALEQNFVDEDSAYRLLFESLDLTTERPPVTGMPSTILFFTALPRSPLDIPVDNIIARALGTNTAIYPVLLASPEARELPEAEPLLRIAEETGGQLIIFQEEAGLDTLARTIASQRLQYKLDYTSRAITPGTHAIRLEVSIDGQEIANQERNFNLDLQPLDVVLLDLPERITRSTDDPSVPLDSLPPVETSISFLTTFSDDYERPLAASQLLVDGQVVDQKTEPPFSPLTWDLRSYLEDETHQIQVRVIDSIGMESLSSVRPVRLSVDLPPQGIAALRPAVGYLLAAIGVLIAGVILAVSVFSLGRGDALPRSLRRPASRADTTAKRRALKREPPEGPAEAFLHPASSDDPGLPAIPLTGVDHILGTDPSLAASPIRNPSVDRLHARLIRQADGSYVLRDQGSTAGTWVNYEPVPETGVRIKHGDIIHLGGAEYRFELVNPPTTRTILVRAVDDDQPGLTGPAQQDES